MNDSDHATAGPPVQAGPQDGGSALRPVTSLLDSDAVILMLARRALNAEPGNPEALLAARRLLDGELRGLLTWPTGLDYALAAGDFERLGRPADAALLRRIAATDGLLASSAREWNTRYDTRPPLPAQHLVASLHEGGLLDLDPAGPLPGTDGSWYQPGALESPGGTEPVLVISARGSSELLVDWPGFETMHAWVASRGSTATGPLSPPPVPGDCRAWQEDQVLARLVTSSGDVPGLVAGLPPDTFTSDVRYEVYQAARDLTRAGVRCTPGRLADALQSRIAAAPRHALPAHGGESGPFLHAYLNRLTATEVTRAQAAGAAASIIGEDEHYRAHAASGSPAPEATTAAAQACAEQPGRPSMAAGHRANRQPDAAHPALQRPAPPASPGAQSAPRM